MSSYAFFGSLFGGWHQGNTPASSILIMASSLLSTWKKRTTFLGGNISLRLNLSSFFISIFFQYVMFGTVGLNPIWAKESSRWVWVGITLHIAGNLQTDDRLRAMGIEFFGWGK